MSTWPPPGPGDVPAPPRGASSPDRRGAYEGRRYPDQYPAEPYPYDRDGYGRDRHFQGDYERDRDFFDYERRRAATRGRSRSPGVDDGRRKRRRSYSPYDRERHDSRARYEDDYRNGRPRSPGGPAYRGPGPRIPDPYEADCPTTFRAFVDWFQITHPEEFAADEAASAEGPKDAEGALTGVRGRYEKYRKTMIGKQMVVMFNYHKGSPWFNERYNPEPPFVNLRLRVRREGWQGLINKFINELDGGQHDPSLKVSAEEPSSHVAPRSPNGEIEMTSPDDNRAEDAAEPPAEGDDEVPPAGKAAEINGNGEAAQEKKAGESEGDAEKTKIRDDEVSVAPRQNQVLIRTIPPDIGRVKLEKICRGVPGFLTLALGDTMQKRNYYRAGWLRFADDADMTMVVDKLSEEKIEGFKLHVTHSTRPFVSRARYTSEAASRPDRIEKDLTNVKKLVALLEDEASNLAKLPEKLPEPRNLKKSQGGELPDDSDVAMSGDGEPPVDTEMSVDPPQEPKDRGSAAVEVRLEKLYATLQAHQPVGQEFNDDTIVAKKNEIALDLYLAYLRAAFNCCYYCSAITDHVEELQRKCIKHVRRNGPSGEVVKDERWEETLDHKTSLLINRDYVDPREHGGKSPEEELSKAVEPHVKQEDEGKFRCKACNKLFKATSFVQKHVSTKHPELVKQLDELPFFNNFALDPHKIQPFTHPPPPSGNGQQAPPEAFGLRAQPNRGPGPEHRARSNSYGYPPVPMNAYYTPAPYPYDPYSNRGYHDYPPAYPPRYGGYEGGRGRSRSPPPPGRKLSDRLGDFVGGSRPPFEGLPAKPPVSTATLEPGPGSAKRRRNGSITADSMIAPMGGPPPPDAREDPRAAAGRKVSYYDIDRMAEGDVELTY